MHSVTQKWIRVRYSAPVKNCARQLRVAPPDVRGEQRVVKIQWRCEPLSDSTREWTDEFGNRVLELRHQRIESEFQFAIEIIANTSGNSLSRETLLPPTGIGAFALPSALCDLSPRIFEIVEQLKASQSLQFKHYETRAELFCDWAFHNIEYSHDATDEKTSASQSLQYGKGVCQDYAHLMIALCRAGGLPARYISGYSAGEGQMHAWVEVLCEDAWVAFDPTHNRKTKPECVAVATGRDYRDVSPHRGKFEGQARAQLFSGCKTRAL
jgi:transglutaminase-like putative cysteine protease